MRRNLVHVLLFVGCWLFSSSCQFKFNVIHHDEVQASKPALEFCQKAFVEKNFNFAYKLSSKELQESILTKDFRDIIEKMHPKGYPTSLEVNEYSPIPGQEAMNIFANGLNKNSKEKFYYRIVMIGTAQKGYKVGSFYRGSGIYPGFKKAISK